MKSSEHIAVKIRGTVSGLISHIVGDAAIYNLERRIASLVFFIVWLIAFTSLFLNYYLGFDFKLIIYTIAAFLTATIFYYIVRFGILKENHYWILWLISILFTDFYIFFSEGTAGAGYFILILLLVMVPIFGKNRILVFLFFLINFFLLLYLEFNYPDLFVKYENDQFRFVDISSAIIFCAVMIFVEQMYFVHSYRKEREKVEQQKKEIERQKDEIKRISNELHASDEMKLRFFANLSHEFRTPLTLILNPVKDLLKTESDNSEFRKQLEYIYNNALKLNDLTNQIMDLQKLDAGKLQLNLEKSDIINYYLSIVSSFESLCHKKNNTLKFISNHSSIVASFDKDKVGKILNNLLSNALKFCYENTVIEIKLELSETILNVSVTDNGIGIPHEQIDSIFNRYYQVTSDKLVEGTGIGLAYVKELVGFMKGNVFINSIVEKGTVIKVGLPLNEYEIIEGKAIEITIHDEDNQSFTEEFDGKDYENEDENSNSVLIVEDNNELRMFIKDLFKNDFVVYDAKNGDEGIKAAFQHIPNLIISDVMMPNKNGFDLCKTLKTDERTCHIPVILLTAKDSIQSNLHGYQTGADDYIVKPFDSELLRLKVKNILATREAIIRQFNAELVTLPNASAYSDIDKRFMKKCMQIIERNIGNTAFSVEQLATELAFSRSNLYRKMQSLTNYNPAELIRNIRMQHASKLLKTSNIRVNEVAMEVGYENTKKFSQAFKKHFGVLPSKVRGVL